MSTEPNIFYHTITIFIVFINIVLIYFLFKAKNLQAYMLIFVVGGSLGNLFDRIYYYAVPDFIDLHFRDFHWFVFNIADIFISLGIICLIMAEIFFNKGTKNEKI